MIWILAGAALMFGYVSLSMFIAAFKETEEVERRKLMKAGLGTLTLCLMGVVFAWYSFHSPSAP
jgi:hypothetical protein